MYNTPVSQESVDKAVAALKVNGIESYLANDGADAKAKVLELIPAGSEVMTQTSATLDTLGISKELNESGSYDSIRSKFATMDSKTQGKEMRRMSSAPDFSVSSAHAVTEDGKIMIVSGTGSQLPAVVYGAAKVVLVVGTQKIVKDIAEGSARIRDYVLPLESARLNKALNITTGSYISKELIINREFQPGRITIVFVPEVVGF